MINQKANKKLQTKGRVYKQLQRRLFSDTNLAYYCCSLSHAHKEPGHRAKPRQAENETKLMGGRKALDFIVGHDRAFNHSR